MAGMEKTMILRRNWLSRFGAEKDGCPKQSQCFLPGAWEKADADSGRAVWGLGGGEEPVWERSYEHDQCRRETNYTHGV